MKGVIDSSANFGMQNWFFVQKDETGITYDYFGFQNHKGTVLIMRMDKAGDNALYYSAPGIFATVFAGKTGYTYVTPVNLNDSKF
jgi:hypothetical protein